MFKVNKIKTEENFIELLFALWHLVVFYIICGIHN